MTEPSQNRSPDSTSGPISRAPSPHTPPRVVIFGAGITGLTVAHELIERGFDVQVVESKPGFDREYEVEVGGVAANQCGIVKASLEVGHPHLFRNLQHAYLEQVAKDIILDEDVKSSTLSGPQQTAERVELEALRSLPMQRSDRSAGLIQRLTFEHREASKTEEEIKLIEQYVASTAPPQAVTDYVNDFLEQLDGHGVTNLLKLKTIGRRMALSMVHRSERLASDLMLAKRFSGEDLAGRLSDTSVRREIFLAEIVGHASPEVANHLAEKLSRVRAQFIRKLLLDRDEIGKILKLPENKQALDRALDLIHGTTTPGRADQFIRDHRLHLVARGAGARRPLGQAFIERRESGRVEIEVVEVRLPGDHGYRFFPAFYRHLFDTMRRTPILLHGDETGETAFDRLVDPRPVALRLPARRNRDDAEAEREIRIPRRHETLEQLRQSLEFLFEELGLSSADLQLFMRRLAQFMTSGKARRLDYEKYSWIEFLDGLVKDQEHDPEYQVTRLSKRGEALVRATLRSLLAMDGEEIDAHSYGVGSLQLLLEGRDDYAAGSDMTLNGPTSDVWLRPWKQYLAQQGVQFFAGQVVRLEAGAAGELRPVALWREHPDCEPDITRTHLEAECAFLEQAERLEARGSHLAPMPEKPGHVYYGWVAGADPEYNTSPPDFYVLALSFEAASAIAWHADKAIPNRLDGDWRKLVDFDAGRIPRDAQGRDTVQFNDVDPVYDTSRDVASGKPNAPLGRLSKTGRRHAVTYPLRDFSGIQYFFDNNTRFGKGHIIYPESPWGLTAISQIGHWRDRKARREGFLGQYSVDIGDFYRAHPKLVVGGWFLRSASASARNHLGVARTAWRSEAWEIPVRVWDQVLETLDPRLADALATPRYYHIDQAIQFAAPSSSASHPSAGTPPGMDPQSMPAANLTPFLINLPGQFESRPGQLRAAGDDHGSRDPNVIWPEVSNGRWVLAGTYMATHTRIMTMEASNESGRHAVTSILHAIMTPAPSDPTKSVYNSQGKLLGELPEIFDPYDYEIDDLRPLKDLDDALHAEGLPHLFDILGLERLQQRSLERRPESALLEHLGRIQQRDWGFLGSAATIPPWIVDPRDLLDLIFGKRAGSADQTSEPSARETGADPLSGLIGMMRNTPAADALERILAMLRGGTS